VSQNQRCEKTWQTMVGKHNSANDTNKQHSVARSEADRSAIGLKQQR
jgi:hypothetical protein